jgi:hypothetical protein
VKALVKPALYVHCWNHCLNLALQDLVKENAFFRDPLSYVHQTAVLISKSPQRVAKLKRIEKELDLKHISVKPFCQTRWTVRGASIHSIIDNLPAILRVLEELADEGDATASGLRAAFSNAETVIALKSALVIFEKTELVAKLLQFKGVSFANVPVARSVLSSLRISMVKDSRRIWRETKELVEKGVIQMPKEKRPVVVPARYRDSETTPTPFINDLERRAVFNHCFQVGRVLEEIEERFSQESIAVLNSISQVLLSPWSTFDEEAFKNVTEFFNADIVKGDLRKELTKTVPAMLHDKSPITIDDLRVILRNLPIEARRVIPQTMRLMKLLLTVPISSAAAERTFSMLRRIKLWTRSTMKQERLNHLALLHEHQDLLEQVDLRKIAEDFVSKNPERRRVFGFFN